MTEAMERTARRRARRKVRLTRRFYIAAGTLVLAVLLIVIIVTLSSGGGGDLGKAVNMAAGLSEAELHRLKVNELGAVMVLEYHRIAEEGRWSRTPENFRADLEFLYNEGYRCISLEDFVSNNITVEAGYTPVVLTFDDSDPSQFRYVEQDGQLVIDPRCALGVMEQFDRDYPDFNVTATFYVLSNLFGQDEYIEEKLAYLVNNGYDIGNHTLNHASLSDLDEQAALKELTGHISLVREYLPDYEQKSIALPYGAEPNDYSMFTEGSYDGIEVRFLASLLVGANPSPAPCSKSFDPMRIPRVQALDPSLDTGDSGIYAWIQFFKDNPERRYVSDGNPDIVTIPKHMIDRVDMGRLGDKRLRTY
jgi:hypothetical protein